MITKLLTIAALAFIGLKGPAILEWHPVVEFGIALASGAITGMLVVDLIFPGA